jgi:5-oxopent-3-ene-1,2,5-tricarboxylate decarboxylase / 2-hydroxyhepta-2,4-diene-1,7-dioate isomerase
MGRVLVKAGEASELGWLASEDLPSVTGIHPPVSGTVYAAALNVRSVLEALGDAVAAPPYKAPPQAPVLYIKPPNTFRPHKGVVPVPHDVWELEVGATLAVVFGRPVSRTSEADALDGVIGYTVAIDVCIPHNSVFRPAIRQRCSDGFLPIGPGIMEKEAVGDPDALRIRVLVNDVERQDFTTAELVRPVRRLIADISDFMTFAAGDVLLVGLPAGCPRACAGDRVSAIIDGVGGLDCTLAPASPLEWLA